MRNSLRVLSVIWLIGAAAPLAAQEIGWSGTLEGSGNLLFGAARGRVFSSAVKAGRADSTLEVQGDARFTYADTETEESGRQVTARGWRFSLGTDYRPFDRVSPFAFASVEASLQQRIESRYSGGVGAKLTLYREGDDDLSVSLAVLGERTRALDPEPDADPVDTRVRWSLRLRYNRALTSAVWFTHTTFYQPTIDELSVYGVETTTSLAVALTSALSLTVTLRDRYDSEAVGRGAVSNHDGQFLFGLRTTF